MLVLAIDTSMDACSAALFDAARGSVLAEACEEMERGHAERLAPMIAEVMAAGAAAFRDVARIIVTRGPGTFTGLRIGLAMARGLGASLGVPVIGIGSLAAIAAGAEAGTPCAVAVAARNGEIYLAAYDAEGAEIVPPRLMRADDAARLAPEGFRIIGSGAERPEFAAVPRAEGRSLPRASLFAHLAAKLDPAAHPPDPLYLRQPDIKPQYSVQLVEDGQALAATLLAQLHGESFERAWSRDEFSTLLAVPQTAALIISHGGEPAGFGLFRRAAEEAEIITLAMRPEFRRRGLARALLGEIERRVSTEGARTLFLEVACSNEAARVLYARGGFREAGRRKDYYARSGGREDALVLRKAL